MYRQVFPDEIAILDNGVTIKPVATLESEHGGRCQISIDDGCYKLSLKQPDGRYKVTPYIFPEAFDTLKHLPSLNIN